MKQVLPPIFIGVSILFIIAFIASLTTKKPVLSSMSETRTLETTTPEPAKEKQWTEIFTYKGTGHEEIRHPYTDGRKSKD